MTQQMAHSAVAFGAGNHSLKTLVLFGGARYTGSETSDATLVLLSE